MSKFFESEIVREELEEIGKLQQEIYGNVISFPTMSRQEQLEHVDKLTELLDKQKIMYARFTCMHTGIAIKSCTEWRISAFLSLIHISEPTRLRRI